MSSSLKVKRLDDLSKQLKNMSRKLKKYDGTHDVSLEVTQEQWDNMTEVEREQCIEKAKNKFVNNMLKDVFK